MYITATFEVAGFGADDRCVATPEIERGIKAALLGLKAGLVPVDGYPSHVDVDFFNIEADGNRKRMCTVTIDHSMTRIAAEFAVSQVLSQIFVQPRKINVQRHRHSTSIAA